MSSLYNATYYKCKLKKKCRGGGTGGQQCPWICDIADKGIEECPGSVEDTRDEWRG